jgi:hypothetical protein
MATAQGCYTDICGLNPSGRLLIGTLVTGNYPYQTSW